MTRHGPALLALSVLAIAGWTYNVNYDTRAALDRLSELRGHIAEEREALQVLRVEWAWLNAPDRLSRLLAEHNGRLALGPLKPEAFGIVAAVPYPPDMPADPVPPSEAPEALIAAAPQAPVSGGTPPQVSGGTPPQVSDAVLAAAAPTERSALTGASQADEPTGSETRLAKPQIAEPAGRPAEAAAEPQFADATPAANEKLAVLTDRAQPPVSMEEAVALALVEAGVMDAKAAGVAVIQASLPASASATIPMPPARPAVWVGR